MPMEKLSGSENISHTNKTVLDFWSWAYSDVLSNRNRAVFAEFLVASALDLTDNVRVEWNAYDLRYKNKKIEVKTSAYLQSWKQAKHSLISFDIAKKRAWDSETNLTSELAERNADCFVFCLFDIKDREKANIFDVSQWKFFVIITADIGNYFGEQKRISLSRLEKICESVSFEKLKSKIDEILSQIIETTVLGKSSVSNKSSYREIGEFWDNNSLDLERTESVKFEVDLNVAEGDEDNSLG